MLATAVVPIISDNIFRFGIPTRSAILKPSSWCGIGVAENERLNQWYRDKIAIDDGFR